MKKIFFLIFLFSLVSVNAQNLRDRTIDPPSKSTNSKKAGDFINVNTPEYPQSKMEIGDLVKNVLVSGVSSCFGSVTEFRVRPILPATNPSRSWGYFNKGSTNFPFDEGIMLMTGPVKYSANFFSYPPLKGKNYTLGDIDLSKGINVDNPLLIDASYITFDFVPVTDRVSFSYIFASEEYGVNACENADGFAFLIKKDGDKDFKNIAVLPNGTPVSVINIHDDNDECEAQNPQYYHGNNDEEIETNFAGRTIPLIATATVIPGKKYHFKIVIADFLAVTNDSAIFLKGGSFNIGINLIDEKGVTLPDVINLCPGTSQILNAGTQTPGSTYQWYFNGNIIPGAISPTYTATQSGKYKLVVLLPNISCPLEVEVTVNITPNPVITLTAPKTTICEGESVLLTASGGKTYTYTGFPGSGNTKKVSPKVTTTYTVTGESSYGCKGNSASLTITVVPKIISILQNIEFCKGSTGILDAGGGPNYTYLWNTGETTQKITVEKDWIYKVTISNGGCSKEFSAVASYIPVSIIEDVIYEDNTLTVKVKNATSNMEYSINKGISWQSSNVFTNILPNVSYFLSVKIPGDFCFATVEFFTFFVNNVITPNGDGINDDIDFSGVSKYGDFSAVVIDRYGNEVFRATESNAIWKPNRKQLNVSSSTYYYQVSWRNPASQEITQKTGWILIKNRN